MLVVYLHVWCLLIIVFVCVYLLRIFILFWRISGLCLCREAQSPLLFPLGCWLLLLRVLLLLLLLLHAALLQHLSCAARAASHACAAEVGAKALEGLCRGCGVPLVPLLTCASATQPLMPLAAWGRRSEQSSTTHAAAAPSACVMRSTPTTVAGGIW